MRIKMLPLLLAALFCTSLTACAGAQSPTEQAADDRPSIDEAVPSAASLAFGEEAFANKAPEGKAAEANLLNGREVGGDLLIGGQPTTEQLEALHAAGYRTVINLQSEAEEGVDTLLAVSKNTFGEGAVHLPVNGLFSIDEENAAKLNEVLVAARARGGKIVLHCRSGGRASALYALARHRHEGVSAAGALAEAKAAGLEEEALIEHLGELLEED